MTKRVIHLLRTIKSTTGASKKAAQTELALMRANGIVVVSKPGIHHSDKEKDEFQALFDRILAEACGVQEN